MESGTPITQSIYFNHNKFLGLPFKYLENGVLVIDDTYTIHLDNHEDILDSILKSNIRKDNGIMFNIRNELFQIIKNKCPNVVLQRGRSCSFLLSFEDGTGNIITIKDSTQFLEYLNSLNN